MVNSYSTAWRFDLGRHPNSETAEDMATLHILFDLWHRIVNFLGFEKTYIEHTHFWIHIYMCVFSTFQWGCKWTPTNEAEKVPHEFVATFKRKESAQKMVILCDTNIHMGRCPWWCGIDDTYDFSRWCGRFWDARFLQGQTFLFIPKVFSKQIANAATSDDGFAPGPMFQEELDEDDAGGKV